MYGPLGRLGDVLSSLLPLSIVSSSPDITGLIGTLLYIQVGSPTC